jgi:hypothetical protein
MDDLLIALIEGFLILTTTKKGWGVILTALLVSVTVWSLM